MMHHMIHARDPITDRPRTRQDLDSESSLLIAVGADTTSTTLAAAFFYLTLPSSLPILQHIQSQLRNTYASFSAITSPSITTHAYLHAIIDETLRLTLPVPLHLPRTIIPSSSGGLTIDGHSKPSGTTVGCSAYVHRHNSTAYLDPFSFRPKRWIPRNDNDLSDNISTTHIPSPSPLQTPEQVSLAREAFTPFSHGSCGCVGK